jgi:integrase
MLSSGYRAESKCYKSRNPRHSSTDFDEFERLVAAAKVTDPRAYLLVLLAAEAGLRLGEMVALEWGDINFIKGQLCVQRSAWKGQIASPKGGRLRYVPLTARLRAALRDHRHVRGPRVLYQDDGSPLTEASSRASSGGQRGRLDYKIMDRTCSATRSARIWRCEERLDAQSRS